MDLPKPAWFNDEQAAPVIGLLSWFIRQLDPKKIEKRQRPLMRKLTVKTLPELFDFNAPDEIDFLWEAILQLANAPYEIWSDKNDRDLDQCNYNDDISLVFNFSAEVLVRNWLALPRITPQQQAWSNELTNWSNQGLDRKLLHQLGCPGIYTPYQILQALENIQQRLTRNTLGNISWRHLSAQFFQGDSKYLDLVSRQQWLLNIFPDLRNLIVPRSLLLNVHLVKNPCGVLIVENQDTFCLLRSQGNQIPTTRNLHLVYGQGFMAGALRGRDTSVLKFSTTGDIAEKAGFEKFWFGCDDSDTHATPVYFWGDLDFSGMAILKALRQCFSSLTAWQPGYAPMVAAVTHGIGHPPAFARKEGQLNPGTTGCIYTDTVISTALTIQGLFLDQEWVSLDLLTPGER